MRNLKKKIKKSFSFFQHLEEIVYEICGKLKTLQNLLKLKAFLKLPKVFQLNF